MKVTVSGASLRLGTGTAAVASDTVRVRVPASGIFDRAGNQMEAQRSAFPLVNAKAENPGAPALAGIAANDEGFESRRLEVRLGYGFAAFGDWCAATPKLWGSGSRTSSGSTASAGG